MSDFAGARIDWRTLSGVDPRRLSEARMQGYFAVQWLARTARGYLVPQPDDGHTNLGWDADGFTTHPMPDSARLHLQLATVTLELRNKDGAQDFALNQHSNADVRQWLGKIYTARGLQADRLDEPSPYDMPAHALAENGRYDTVGFSDALRELAAWFANAQSSLDRIRAKMMAHEIEVSDLRCWPHHFDLATLASFPMRDNETGYVGAGLSPGDHYYDEPYFYVSIYPRPDAAKLPALPEIGQWHTHEFTAAVTTASRMLAAKAPQAETEEFLDAAVTRAFAILR